MTPSHLKKLPRNNCLKRTFKYKVLLNIFEPTVHYDPSDHQYLQDLPQRGFTGRKVRKQVVEALLKQTNLWDGLGKEKGYG